MLVFFVGPEIFIKIVNMIQTGISIDLCAIYDTCGAWTDDLADKLNAGDGLVGDLLPSIGGKPVEGELILL